MLAKKPLASWGIQTALFSERLKSLHSSLTCERQDKVFDKKGMRRQMVSICISLIVQWKPTFSSQKAMGYVENEYPVFLKNHNRPFPTIDV